MYSKFRDKDIMNKYIIDYWYNTEGWSRFLSKGPYHCIMYRKEGKSRYYYRTVNGVFTGIKIKII